MTGNAIFIAPGDNGYEFSGCDEKVNARLLALMAPSSSDLIEEGAVSPFIRADWVSKKWLLPRGEILLMVGLRASISGTPSYRGSNSIWAAATVLNVKRSPASTEIRSELTKLADSFIAAFGDKSADDQFKNNSHISLARILRAEDIESSIKRTREIIESGRIPSPFFR